MERARKSGAVSKALVVRPPWIEKILRRQKTWELRSRRTKARGPIGLIESRSGMVVGICDVVDVVGPLSLAALRRTVRYHKVPPTQLSKPRPYKKTYAWVLRHARRLNPPIIVCPSLRGRNLGTASVVRFEKNRSEDVTSPEHVRPAVCRPSVHPYDGRCASIQNRERAALASRWPPRHFGGLPRGQALARGGANRIEKCLGAALNVSCSNTRTTASWTAPLMDDVNLWRDDHSPTLSMRDWRYLHDRSYS
jgi:hypothetical protein